MMDVADYRLRLAIVFELKAQGVKLGRLSKSELRVEKEACELQPMDETQVFGIPLKTVVNRAGVEVDGLVVPRIVHEVTTMVRANLGAKGLFRVCGSAARMRNIQRDVDGGQSLSSAVTVHDQAGLLKMFFRALPDPLCTFRLYAAFIAAFKLADVEARKKALLMLCLLMPEENLHTLAHLMRLLHDIAADDANKMTASSLASILTPNLLRPPVEQTGQTSQAELANHASCVGAIELLIDNAAEIGGVPVEVVRQAQDMTDPARAQKLYERQINGRTKWWSRGYRPRRGSRQTNAVSVQTLNLLKKSEKTVKEQHTPSLGRRRLGGGGAAASGDAAAAAAPVQYSQMLGSASSREHVASPLGKN